MSADVSRRLGLVWLGISHEILAPNKRSSWPHAHSHEEEFILVLKGHPRVWLNGWEKTLSPGDLVFFGPHVAHSIRNPQPEEVEYLVWGQTAAVWPEDKLFYPMHPKRNEECRRENIFWEDFCPPTPCGTSIAEHTFLCSLKLDAK